MKRVAWMVATWFGCGFSPVAPGTVGSAAAVLIAMGLTLFFERGAVWLLIPAALLIAPGIWAAGVTSRERGAKDPGFVVVDEVIGQWVTLAGATSLNWKSWLGAFFLFRLLDIWKPFPARNLEAWPGGLGIVADDVMAGIYGALVLFTAGCFKLY